MPEEIQWTEDAIIAVATIPDTTNLSISITYRHNCIIGQVEAILAHTTIPDTTILSIL